MSSAAILSVALLVSSLSVEEPSGTHWTLFGASSHGTGNRPMWNGTRGLGGFYYQVSAVYGRGGLFPGAPGVPLTGVGVHERHGLISYALTWALIAVSIMESQYTSSTTSSSRVVFDGLYSKTIETTTTTTYTKVRSDQEVLNDLVELTSGISGQTWADLTVYGDPLLGLKFDQPGGQGYELSFGLDASFGDIAKYPMVLDFGFTFGHVRVRDTPMMRPYEMVGFMTRFYFPLGPVGWLTAELDINLRAAFDADRFAPSFAKGGAELLLTDRVFARGQATVGYDFAESGGSSFGFVFEAGVRL